MCIVLSDGTRVNNSLNAAIIILLVFSKSQTMYLNAMLVFCCGESGNGVQLTYRENIQTQKQKMWWNIFLTPTFIMLTTKHGIQFWSVLYIIFIYIFQNVKKIFDFIKKIFEFVISYSSVSVLQCSAMHGWNDMVHCMS